MAEENRSNSFMAFLIGASAGAVAALMLAPRSGRETRRRLGLWIGDLEDKSLELAEKSRGLMEEGKETAAEEAEKAARIAESSIPH